jgi:predicted metal-dependent hydrolase
VDRVDIEGQFLSNCIASLGVKWNASTIVSRVEIQFSDRMSSSLGRCLPIRGIVRLNRRLLRAQPALFEEVICHEVAT